MSIDVYSGSCEGRVSDYWLDEGLVYYLEARWLDVSSDNACFPDYQLVETPVIYDNPPEELLSSLKALKVT